MQWLNTIIKKSFNYHMRQVQRATEAPLEAQAQVFRQLYQQLARTKFGQERGITKASRHSSHSNLLEQFQQHIPIQHYEDLAPYIQAMMHGATDVLWPGKVSYFSRSSGTTGSRSKFIPVSPQNLKQCHLKGAHDALSIWFHNQPKSELFHYRKAIIMGGEVQAFNQQAKTQVGDVSAIIVKHLPIYGIPFLIPNIATALLPDWEEKIERIAQVAVHQDVSNLSGVPTWTLVLFRRILELSGKASLSEVFPNFELYAHGGVNFAPYRAQFQALFPCGTVQYRNTYNASEGFFATQFSAVEEGMNLLCDNGVFYEFIPLKAYQQSVNPKTLSLEEVEIGTHYVLLISTNAGLWRYCIGDTIEFTSLRPYQIKISGRTKQFINVFGEEVMVGNTEQALAATCREFGVQVRDYTVAPIFLSEHNKGGHEWWIEFEQPPSQVQAFKRVLDQQLQAINSDYQAKRYKNIALKELELKVLPKGTFHDWLRQQGKYGGQHKVPRLSNDRKYVQALAAILLTQSST